MATKLEELRGQLNAKRDELHKVFEQAGENYDMSKVDVIEGDSAAKVEWIKATNKEMSDLKAEIDELDGLKSVQDGLAEMAEIDRGHTHNTGTREDAKRTAQQQRADIGALIVASDAIKGKKRGEMTGPSATIDVDVVATLLETGTGWAPYDFRSPRLVDFATRPLRVVDLIPTTQTDAAAISYMEETTFTNAAVEVTEGSAKPEAALAYTERTDTVRKIAVWIPSTDEQLDDVPRLRGLINNRLGNMVRLRLDSQILVGDGTAPNISGIEDRSGIQTQALGADPTPDAFYKAMQKIRVNAFSEPSGIVMHPDDWTPIRLLRTADGIYIWGSPSEPGPDRMWGLPVVQTTAQTANTGLVGDFQQAELAVRQGVDVQVSNSHSDFFVKNLQAIRAEMRAALAVYRPAAFCTVTGI